MNQKAYIGVRNLTYRLSRRTQGVASFRTADGLALPFASTERIKGALKLSRHLCALSLGAALGLSVANAASAQNAVPPELRASKGKPPSGAITQLTPACRAAKRYIDLAIAGRYEEIGDLFADKVDYVGPDFRALGNREDIRKGYIAIGEGEIKAGNPPGPRLERLVPLNDNECFMEFERFDHAAAAYRLFAVDHFIVGPDGKIIWFRPYFQESSSHWHDDYVRQLGDNHAP
jgi:hypothetical protein